MKSQTRKILKDHEIKLIILSVKIEMMLDILEQMNVINKQEFLDAMQPGIDKLKLEYEEYESNLDVETDELEEDIESQLKYMKYFGQVGDA